MKTEAPIQLSDFQLPQLTEEQKRRVEQREREKREREEREEYEMRAPWRKYKEHGYDKLTLESYFVTEENEAKLKQQEAIKIVRDYINQIGPNVDEGYGLTFAGRVGTGKDHLACIVLEASSRLFVQHHRGIAELANSRRIMRAYGTNSSGDFDRLCSVQVLLLSDPVSGGIDATNSKMQALNDLIGARYDKKLVTHITINAQYKSQAEEMLGSPAWDRLKQMNIDVGCTWDSYRAKIGEWK